MTIFIVGLGLIGASYAERLRELNHDVHGYDQNPDIMEKALNDGCILSNDVKLIYKAELIIIALYPDAIIDFIKDHAERFTKGQVITDVSGVKTMLVSTIELLLPRGVHYVSHHPMAGKETPGYDARDSTLFNGSNAILIKTDKTDISALDKLQDLLQSVGFSSCITTTKEHHDLTIAWTSQLPHVLAMVLVHNNDHQDISKYIGNSFRDLTRIASINKNLWSELFFRNQSALNCALDDTIESLNDIKKMIEHNHEEALMAYMDDVKEKRDSYGND